jgi:8-oxo-dGTP pyrophosphatase MutT (NUDIX family)
MIIYCPFAKTFLMGRRAWHMHKPGLWNFFGGHVDEHESAEEGVLRELREETGILLAETDIIRLGQSEMSDIGYVSGLRDLHYFLMFTDSEIEPTLNHEHSEFRWFTRSSIPHHVNRPTAIALTIGLAHKTELLAQQL